MSILMTTILVAILLAIVFMWDKIVEFYMIVTNP